jgi:hypothetical protein
MIQRRAALKNLLLIAGGTMLLPSCLNSDRKVSIPLNNLQISADDEELLAEIAETIIPKTNTPGAKELGVHQFVLVMVDDCSSREEQQAFSNGMKLVNKVSKEKYGKPFVKCTPEQRQQLLTKIDANEFEADKSLNEFFSQTKRYTIQGYLKSQYVMSNLLVYELVPGRFHGSVPVSDKTRLVQNG